MNKRTHISLLAFTALALAALVLAHNVAERKVSAAPAATYLLSSLPASDAVIFIDAQRLLADSIPGMLANSPKVLARVNEEIDRFKEKTNIDLRNTDSIAVGVGFNPPDMNREFKLVLLAQGRFDANAALDAVLEKARREGFYPYERQFDGRSIYVLSRSRQPEAPPQETADNQQPTPHRDEMAIAVVDANTLAFGDLQRVRATLDISAERVSDDLVQLATRTPNAIIGFSGNAPAFITDRLARDKEPLAKNFAAIRQVYGSISANGSDAEAALTLRAETATQAQEMGKSVNALKLLVSLDQNRAPNAGMRSITQWIKSLNVTNEGNEVFLTLKLKQADIVSFAQSL